MKINTAELEGLALCWVMAQIDPQCEGLDWQMRDGVMCGVMDDPEKPGSPLVAAYLYPDSWVQHTRMRIQREPEFRRATHYSPSTLPAQGQRLLDKNGISTRYDQRRKVGWEAYLWEPSNHDLSEGEALTHHTTGPTQLIAGLRTLVLSIKGPVVDIPEELLK